jgi:phage-related protein
MVLKSPKPLRFLGDSHDILASFPEDVRRAAGFALYMVQIGRDPDDWKPMTTIGSGVREIRLRDASGAFRLIYIAKFQEAIYVLHCFNKKSQQTAAKDIELSRNRLKQLLQDRSQ